MKQKGDVHCIKCLICTNASRWVPSLVSNMLHTPKRACVNKTLGARCTPFSFHLSLPMMPMDHKCIHTGWWSRYPGQAAAMAGATALAVEREGPLVAAAPHCNQREQHRKEQQAQEETDAVDTFQESRRRQGTT